MSPDLWNNPPPGFIRPSKSAPCSPAKPLGVSRTRSDSFHITHKVPVGDTPYVRAKNVQLVDKDPEKAIPLFWAAINAGDRVDSALKDMAIVMKQQNRAEEAIEAIKSLRTRCSDQAQESLDNILLDLYKRCGRIDDQIALLKHKLYLIQQGMAFNGKRTKTARSQGKKFQVSVEQEATRLLGNLGWAFMQQNNYIEAEDAYRRALSIAPDNNKMCNLGICLMKQGRIAEAKENLRRVRPAMVDGPRGVDSHLKAFERAQQMLQDLESEMMNRVVDRVEQSRLFDVFLGSSSIWQPQPCRESGAPPIAVTNTQDNFADENVDKMTGINNNGVGNSLAARNTKSVRSLVNSLNIDAPLLARSSKSIAAPLGNLVNIDAPPLARSTKTAGLMENSLNIDGPPLSRSTKFAIAPLVNSLNIDAPPFHLWKWAKDQTETQFQDPLGGLKRTRSVGNAHHHFIEESVKPGAMLGKPEDKKPQGISTPTEEDNEWTELLPDSANFEESIVAAVIGYTAKAEKREEASAGAVTCQKKVDKRLRVFQDITLSLSPRA